MWLVARQKFSPALITESELLEISEREIRPAVLERIASSSNPITDDAVWEKTMAELGRGWLKGPLLAAEVPNHCPLSRRFGVVQGQKVRCVDDYNQIISEPGRASYRVTISQHKLSQRGCPRITDGRNYDRSALVGNRGPPELLI